MMAKVYQSKRGFWLGETCILYGDCEAIHFSFFGSLTDVYRLIVGKINLDLFAKSHFRIEKSVHMGAYLFVPSSSL